MDMSNSPVVVLVEPNTIVKSRVRSVLANQQVKIYDVVDRRELLSVLSKNDYNIDLIITEIELDTKSSFDGVSLIQLVKEKRSAIPVVILTSVSKKEVITKCLLEGASDYILKPFEDDFLKNKLLKYINVQNLTELTTLKFNLMNFLDGEIYKAKKGKYQFSLIKVDFYSKDKEKEKDNENPSQYSFYKFSEAIYQEIKSLFWDADLYIEHGFQSHLGFFPFCKKENTQIVTKKINSKFISYKSIEPGLDHYLISLASVTYPNDGDTSIELLNKLTEQLTPSE